LSGPGIRSTIAATRAYDVTHAGTGETLSEASAAGVRNVRGHRVGLVAAATVTLGPAAAAGEGEPGINLLRVRDEDDRARNLASIRDASDTTDVLFVYQHFQVEDQDVVAGNEFGHKPVSDLDAWQREWARSVIDAGASVYVAHGSRELKGVEVYKGRLIFYGLGNFIFHSGQPIGHYEPDVWESVIATVTFRGHEPTRVDFVPIVLDEGSNGPNFLERRGVPEVAGGPRAATILSRLEALSADFGTEITVVGQAGRLELGQSRGLGSTEPSTS
jgi:poly-gamma-glutamate capsule biosynthesis protein CapA/YwtB (metallophosphatase superfamily)